MPTTEKLKARLQATKDKKKPKVIGLSTGLTLLNLACSGRTSWGILPGHVYLLIGKSQAGKTWLLRTIMAELANNPHFEKYRIIDDNPERGALMDMPSFYGKTLANRLEPPSKHGSSRTLEDFYDNCDDACKDGRPFLYGLDSEDALSSETQIKKAEKDKNIRRRTKIKDDEKIKGSYGDGKAKVNSSSLRLAHNGLEPTGSILIIIKQSRDNIGWDAMYNPETRSGGRALTFYASLEMWFSIAGKIKKTVKGKQRIIGTYLRIHVKKNRMSGRDRVIEVPFYPTYGLDDLGSLVDFLVEETHWKKEGKDDNYTLKAPEFSFEGKKDKLIQRIEEQNREKELKLLAAEVWHEIEDACAVTRKKRYQ